MTTTNEAFEKWWTETKGNEIKHIGLSSFTEEVMFAAWQASKAESEKEIAELQELLKDRQSDLDFEYNRAEQNVLEVNAINEANEQIAELQADNQRLREALEKVAYMGTDNAMGTDREYFMQRQLGHCIGIASEALAIPAQSLKEHDE